MINNSANVAVYSGNSEVYSANSVVISNSVSNDV